MLEKLINEVPHIHLFIANTFHNVFAILILIAPSRNFTGYSASEAFEPTHFLFKRNA